MEEDNFQNVDFCCCEICLFFFCELLKIILKFFFFCSLTFKKKALAAIYNSLHQLYNSKSIWKFYLRLSAHVLTLFYSIYENNLFFSYFSSFSSSFFSLFFFFSNSLYIHTIYLYKFHSPKKFIY
jgi:hypothetical protein